MFYYINQLRTNLLFVQFKSFLESNSPDIIALYETNLDNLIDSGNLSVSGYLPYNQEKFYYSYACSSSLSERSAYFCMQHISRKL